MYAYVACKITVPERCASAFSFLFFFFFFFSTSFLRLHQVEIYTTISSSLHWFFAQFTLAIEKNTRSTTKVTSRNLVEHSKVQGVEEIEEKKKKTVNIAVNALEKPTRAQRWEPWQTCRAPQVRAWASLMRNEPKQHSDHCSEVVAMNSPSAALQRRQPGWALSKRDERELQRHSISLWGSRRRRLRLPAIPSTHATTDGRTLPAYPSKAKANRTKPLITADTSETSLYKTEAVDSKNRRFQDWQWTEHVDKQLQSPHRRRRRWSTWPILTKHTSIESSTLPLSACHGAIAVNRSMRGTIALIGASLNCAMHSTQCDAESFRQKPALQMTSLISLHLADNAVELTSGNNWKLPLLQSQSTSRLQLICTAGAGGAPDCRPLSVGERLSSRAGRKLQQGCLNTRVRVCTPVEVVWRCAPSYCSPPIGAQICQSRIAVCSPAGFSCGETNPLWKRSSLLWQEERRGWTYTCMDSVSKTFQEWGRFGAGGLPIIMMPPFITAESMVA